MFFQVSYNSDEDTYEVYSITYDGAEVDYIGAFDNLGDYSQDDVNEAIRSALPRGQATYYRVHPNDEGQTDLFLVYPDDTDVFLGTHPTPEAARAAMNLEI